MTVGLPAELAAAASATALDDGGPSRVVGEDDVRRALADHELETWFQPKIETGSGRVAGAEALLRWRRPEHGLTGPAEILSAAAESGLMIELTRYVLADALSSCSRWRPQGLTLPIAVNVAPSDLADETLPDLVEALLDELRLPGELLTLEITETAMLQDAARSSEVMQRLRRLGVALSADDFGVGYSSLSRLVQLPLSELKVDMGLIFGMHTSPHGLDAVRAIVDLGHTLGLRVVAEGVEDGRTLDELRRVGCDLAQGFLIARPMPADDVPSWIAARQPVPAEPPSAPVTAGGRLPRSVRSRTASVVDAVGLPGLALAGIAFALLLGWQVFGWGGPEHRTLISDLTFVPVNAATIALCWLAGHTHRHDPRLRRGWWWMSAAWSSYLLGDLIQMTYEVGLHRELPYPSWSDAGYLSFYPIALIGLLSFPTPRRSRAAAFTVALDVGVVAAGASSLIWAFYLSPTAQSDGAVSLSVLTGLAYPAGDIVLLFGVISLLMRGCISGSAGPMRVLVGSLGLLLVTDLVYGELTLNGGYANGDLLDIGWIGALILFSLGALAHARRGRRVTDQLEPTPEAGAGRRLRVDRLPYLAVIVGFALLIVTSQHLPLYPVGGLLLAVGFQTCLVMMRQATALRDNSLLLGRYHALANTDSLTGLHNRRHFLELAEATFATAHRLDDPLTMLMIDIDYFKQINDRFGHQTGDQVLCAVADVVRTNLRPFDLVGRYGGDELVALLPDTSSADSHALAGRLQERLRDLLHHTGVGAQPATMSIGIAELGDARSLDTLLARADMALYDAKRAGRNCVREFHPDPRHMGAPSVQRTSPEPRSTTGKFTGLP